MPLERPRGLFQRQATIPNPVRVVRLETPVVEAPRAISKTIRVSQQQRLQRHLTPPKKKYSQLEPPPVQKFNSLISICKMKRFQHVAKSYQVFRIITLPYYPGYQVYSISAQNDYVNFSAGPGPG